MRYTFRSGYDSSPSEFPRADDEFCYHFRVKIQRNSRKETIGYLEISQHAKGDEYDHWLDLLSNKPQARWHRLVKEPQDETAGNSAIASEQSVAK